MKQTSKVRTFDDILTDKQKMINRVNIMGLPTKKALLALEAHGYKIEARELQKMTKKINAKRQDYLYWLAKEGLEDLHLTTLQTLKVCEKEYWENYLAEDDHYKRATILDKIVSLQPWISIYADATQDIIAKQMASRKIAETVKPDSLAKQTAVTK